MFSFIFAFKLLSDNVNANAQPLIEAFRVLHSSPVAYPAGRVCDVILRNGEVRGISNQARTGDKY